MCAMIPMFRTRARSTFAVLTAIALPPSLPAIVREGLVGLGHLVGVLTTLHAGAQAVAGVEDLVHQPLGHRLLPPVAGVTDQPPQRERGGPVRLDLDRHLVG